MAWSNDRVNPFWGVRVISNNWFEVKFWFKEDFGGWEGNVKFRNGSEEVRILKVFNGIKTFEWS